MAEIPWYKIVTPRREVREGRSFSPDEFAIALEQVVAGNAPEDYRDPAQFFSRTCFTRALKDHSGMVLRRLAGRTENAAPVLTLVTQFGGGKTHTLTSLYHLANAGAESRRPSRGCRIFSPRRICRPHLPHVWGFSSAMLGTRRTAGRRRGSIWRANSRAIAASRRSAAPRSPRRRGPRRWPRCSLPRTRRCCCFSTRC